MVATICVPIRAVDLGNVMLSMGLMCGPQPKLPSAFVFVVYIAMSSNSRQHKDTCRQHFGLLVCNPNRHGEVGMRF